MDDQQYCRLCVNHTWMIVTQPIGFIVAIIGLIGKLELPPFDAPEAEQEIVSGALSEYSGRDLDYLKSHKKCGTCHWSCLITVFYLGGIVNPLLFP
jgi:NADH-quinone oxidoreductase subunit H